ncbi:hypothetical protein ACJONP_03690 [Mycoplasmopsis synoviae]
MLSKSSKVPGLSWTLFVTLDIVTPFIAFVTNTALNLGSNLLT